MTPVEIALRQAERDLVVAEKRVIKQQQSVTTTKRGTPPREQAERELTSLLDAYALARSARDARMHEARAAGLILGLKREKRVKR
jgi:hypothetical protein